MYLSIISWLSKQNGQDNVYNHSKSSLPIILVVEFVVCSSGTIVDWQVKNTNCQRPLAQTKANSVFYYLDYVALDAYES